MEPKPVDGPAINSSPQVSRAERTAQGIAEARSNGIVWGSFGPELAFRNKNGADAFAEQLRPMLIELLVSGCKGPTAVAGELNKRGIVTRYGDRWCTQTVFRLIRRLGPSLQEAVNQQRAERLANAKNTEPTHNPITWCKRPAKLK